MSHYIDPKSQAIWLGFFKTNVLLRAHDIFCNLYGEVQSKIKMEY